MGFYELLLQVGGVVGFWINYGVSKHIPISTKQWHIPVAVQLIPGGLLFIGALFVLPESPRWLRSVGRLEEAERGLAHIRNLPADHTYMREELEMMDEQLAATAQYRSYGAQIKELMAKGMRNRLASAFLMMSTYTMILEMLRKFSFLTFLHFSFLLLVFQNLTGINAINYYSPRIFQSLGLVGTDAQLFGTGIYGIVKLVVTLIWAIWLIDNVGRRKLIIIGSVGAICTSLSLSLFFSASY